MIELQLLYSYVDIIVCPHLPTPPLAAPAMSTLSGYGVANASYVAMFSNFGGTCVSDDLRLGPSAGYEGLNHHNVDGNGCLI